MTKDSVTTPLPWKVDEEFCAPASNRCVTIRGPKGEAIAFVNIWSDAEEEGLANLEKILMAVNNVPN